MVCELKMMEEMLMQDVFSGRWDLDAYYNVRRRFCLCRVSNFCLNQDNINGRLRGGHGMHGIIGGMGEEWKEQRRFALRNLRDFGFGKSSMEEIVMEEFRDLAEDLRGRVNKGDIGGVEVQTSQLFNMSVLNVLWQIMTGKRFDRKNTEQKRTMQNLTDMFASFGTNNILTILSLTVVPKFLRPYDPVLKKIGKFYADIFAMFEKEYNEHERSYDEDHMRDFTDVYIRERQRITMAGEASSSFHGEKGRWNFLNTFFDLFLAGSETTSTSLMFTLLYLVHFPSVQRRLQAEIDAVVGRSRLPCLADKEQMPYLEAFMAEVQRHAIVAPFTVQHATLEDTTFRGHRLPKNTMITINQAEVMRDPANFDRPDRFDPNRFLDEEGKFRSHPALLSFGLGKRECPGKSVAKIELFLFTACLAHQFNFEPAAEGLPGLDDATIAITRMPCKFKVTVLPRTD